MGLNPTGVKPVGYKVLIRVDEVEDRSAGGLFLPQASIERDAQGFIKGTLVDASEAAFTGEAWPTKKPVFGCRVIFNKYSGSIIEHMTGKRTKDLYRLCDDGDIGAILEDKE